MVLVVAPAALLVSGSVPSLVVPRSVTSSAARCCPGPETRPPSLLRIAAGGLRPWVRRWRIVVIRAESGIPTTTAASSSSTTPAAPATGPPVLLTRHTRRVHDPAQDSEEENAKQDRAHVEIPVRATAAAAQVGIPALALVGEGEAVLDPAAALEDVRVVFGAVALADDVRGAELELLGQLGDTGPLDVLGAVAGALVGAAHDVDGEEVAEGLCGEAFELRGGGRAAVGCEGAVAAEGEGLHIREEDCVFGLAGCCGEGQQQREGE